MSELLRLSTEESSWLTATIRKVAPWHESLELKTHPSILEISDNVRISFSSEARPDSDTEEDEFPEEQFEKEHIERLSCELLKVSSLPDYPAITGLGPSHSSHLLFPLAPVSSVHFKTEKPRLEKAQTPKDLLPSQTTSELPPSEQKDAAMPLRRITSSASGIQLSSWDFDVQEETSSSPDLKKQINALTWDTISEMNMYSRLCRNPQQVLLHSDEAWGWFKCLEEEDEAAASAVQF